MTIYLATLWMLFGVAVHFLTVLASLEDAGTPISPLAYLKLHPYRAALMVSASFMLLIIVNEMHQLTQVTALLLGYTCQEANDRLRQRANTTILKKEKDDVQNK